MNLVEALSVQQGDVVAFVGGGGKTSAMLRLGQELAWQGARVLSTTLYDINRREIDQSIHQFGLGSVQIPPPSLAEGLETHRHVFVYQKVMPDGKLQGPRAGWFEQHIISTPWADVVLVEADSAQGRSLTMHRLA